MCHNSSLYQCYILIYKALYKKVDQFSNSRSARYYEVCETLVILYANASKAVDDDHYFV